MSDKEPANNVLEHIKAIRKLVDEQTESLPNDKPLTKIAFKIGIDMILFALHKEEINKEAKLKRDNSPSLLNMSTDVTNNFKEADKLVNTMLSYSTREKFDDFEERMRLVVIELVCNGTILYDDDLC